MKLSKYIEISEPFGKKNHRILFSIMNTKSILINDHVYKALLNNRFDRLSQDVLKNLSDLKILIQEEINETLEFLNESEVYINNNKTLYEVIQPSADCQLGCSYCGQVHNKKTLDNELDDKLIKRIESKLDSKEYEHLSIGWFGGEPLLAISKIEKLSEKFRSLVDKIGMTYSSSITTNGIGLKKSVFKRLLHCNVKEIDITLDGYLEEHDIRRPVKSLDFVSSYKIIMKNLSEITQMEEFEENKTRLIIRSNIDKKNYKNILLLIDDLIKNRLHKKIHTFYLAPIHSWGNDAHKDSLNDAEFSKVEIQIMIYLIKNGFKIGVLPNSPKKQVCMSLSKQGEVYDAYGNIFNCTEIPYVDVYKETDYYLGSLNDSKVLKERNFNSWIRDLKNGSFPCTNCKILPICGGACPKAWHEGNPPCPSIKYNLKERLLIFAQQTFA